MARLSNHVEPRGTLQVARHYIRELIYGANDGIITTFAVVAGVAGGGLSPRVILICGVANLLADGLSMASGNYLSIRSHESVLEAQGLPEEEASPVRHGVATLLAFVTAGAVPLLPFAFPGVLTGQFALSIALAFLVLFGIGACAHVHWNDAVVGRRGGDARSRGRGLRRRVCERRARCQAARELSESGGTMSVAAAHSVEGQVGRGFEPVREAFADNFSERHELGGACCVWHRGEKIVDLWGGIRNKQTGEPWERDTMVLVYSATKGLAAMTLAIAHSRGWLDYEERVCTYWPRVRAAGKRSRHRPPAPGPSGRALCVRRARRSQHRRRSRSPGGGAGSSAAGVGARNSAGVSRDQPRLLRG